MLAFETHQLQLLTNHKGIVSIRDKKQFLSIKKETMKKDIFIASAIFVVSLLLGVLVGQ